MPPHARGRRRMNLLCCGGRRHGDSSVILSHPSRALSRAPSLSDQEDLFWILTSRKSARFLRGGAASPDVLASGRPPYPVPPSTIPSNKPPQRLRTSEPGMRRKPARSYRRRAGLVSRTFRHLTHLRIARRLKNRRPTRLKTQNSL
jgi:hypothetical protein